MNESQTFDDISRSFLGCAEHFLLDPFHLHNTQCILEKNR